MNIFDVNQEPLIARTIENAIFTSLKQYPVIALTGPRQSGKTTLVRSISDYDYRTLEDPDNKEFATEDPRGFLNSIEGKAILDEVQNVPSLFSYIQGRVDQSRIMGQYILSGSQNFQMMAHITQSLAGRVAIHNLLPLDLMELKQADLLPDDIFTLCTNGSYPAIYDRELNADRYYANYINTYVERDISQLVNIQDKSTFKRFLKICASRAGSLVNYNNIAKDVGVSHTTIRNWLSILETSYVITLLTPFYKNYSKRQIKSPKLYFWDTGLLCHLLDIRKGNLQVTHPLWGHIFEQLIVVDYLKKNAHLDQLRTYHFWRDSKGHEVDLLYAENNQLHIHEIKASTTIQNKHLAGLNYFTKISSDPITSRMLIYGGAESQSRTNYKVIAWRDIAKSD